MALPCVSRYFPFREKRNLHQYYLKQKLATDKLALKGTNIIKMGETHRKKVTTKKA